LKPLESNPGHMDGQHYDVIMYLKEMYTNFDTMHRKLWMSPLPPNNNFFLMGDSTLLGNFNWLWRHGTSVTKLWTYYQTSPALSFVLHLWNVNSYTNIFANIWTWSAAT